MDVINGCTSVQTDIPTHVHTYTVTHFPNTCLSISAHWHTCDQVSARPLGVCMTGYSVALVVCVVLLRVH